MTWSGIITIPVAVILGMLSCLIMVVTTFFAIGFSARLNAAFEQVDSLPVIGNLTSQVHSIVGNVMALIVLIVLINFIFHVLLCKGVCENKVGMIIAYIIYGGVVFGFQANYARKRSYGIFYQEDVVQMPTYYGLYLIMLIIHAIEVQLSRKSSKGVIVYHVTSRASDV